ncbi:U3 small nucleolar RNA-associated protein 11 [Periconia macrospinosa]|uniref:U3 small nucleolar RNA-associated protein 11 n=1 Tax=Periconia macrospinosa TaxID=97972 RepID=A0A2V1D988_9PLEO|nr:U3 small nucleolar RNA-associated protein 11 [Periconia macrospinosa]
MSSIRNAVQRRNHKERAQPEERAKWGLLEKRKDYKLRAADHREKKKRIKILKEKATDRNPDEFSFGMLNSKVDAQGRKVADRGNKALDVDVVKLLKTQDAGYIRTMLQIVRKEREELERKMMLSDEAVKVLGKGGKKAKHTVFVGDVEEQEEFDEEEWFGAGAECPAWNRPRKSEEKLEETGEKKLSKKQQEAKEVKEKEERSLMAKRARLQERSVAHLEAVKARERDLVAAEEELEKQRAKMNNTVGGTNKHGVKFKIRERKR